ncbi:MAG: LptF/LptG family permease [Parachlamydiaceae bacterium]|nr:LptF/LptG family permease [Parachlamydiaceae bacterium]
MIFKQIWERYFLKEFIKVFLLFLLCFYGLYVIIDYASHTSALPHHHVQIKVTELARYYLYIFSSRAEVLIPLALLIAAIKTLSTLNVHGELVALMASGFKIKTLMRPFIIMGLLGTLLIFLNEQYIVPSALKKLRRIEDATKHQRTRSKLIMTAHQVLLEDGSLFIYQSYDASKEQFFDSYWIPSVDQIYRIKYLSPLIHKGYFVDRLERQRNGELKLIKSDAELELPHIRFNEQVLQSTIIDPDALSLSALWSEAPIETNRSDNLSEKQSKILAAFYWKMTIPWLCLLAIIAPIPFCIYFSRQFPLFLVYICGIFGLIAFYFFMDAALVVAKRQVLDPIWAITAPFSAIFIFFGWRYLKNT